MPATSHTETHFTAGALVRDIVIGMSDGLTVPFALAAGLTGAISNTGVIVTAGSAEIAAGSIAMGLGGYLAARGDAEHYGRELAREAHEIKSEPEVEAQEVHGVFRTYGLTEEESATVVASLRRRPKDWVAFMMRFELGLERPVPGRAWKSALTIAAAYIVGGIIPLSAYLMVHDVHRALLLGGCDAVCPGRVWRSEGPLHGHSRAARRVADHAYRGAGRGRRVPDRALDRVSAATPARSARVRT